MGIAYTMRILLMNVVVITVLGAIILNYIGLRSNTNQSGEGISELALLKELTSLRGELTSKMTELQFAFRKSGVTVLNADRYPTSKRVLDLLPIITYKKEPPRLAVVVPFIKAQKKILFDALRQWGVSRRPCDTINKPEYKDYMELFFHYDLDFNDADGLLQEMVTVIKNMTWIKKCFSQVSFISANLTVMETVIRQGKKGSHTGPNKMWKSIFYRPEFAGFDFWVQIEPDIFALRQNWLDRIYELVAFAIEDFWMKGGNNKNPKCLCYHIHGSAIYKLHDIEFLEVVEQAGGNYDVPFDVGLWTTLQTWRRSSYTIAKYKKNQHKVVLSNYLQDWSDIDNVPYKDLLKNYNETYLIHSKNLFRDWIDGRVSLD